MSRDLITQSASSAERTEIAEDLRQSAAIMSQTIMSPLKLQEFKCHNVKYGLDLPQVSFIEVRPRYECRR